MAGHELIPPPHPPPASTMQDPKGAGRSNLQGKLRLKRSNSDSKQALPGSHASKISFANDAPPPQTHSNDELDHQENCKSNPKDDDQDSLVDFKSPKRDIVRKSILNKYKIEKTKRKTAAKSRKSSAKQPSIEFSLLKTSNENQPDLKEAVPCPVCLKPFKDDATCTNHMKSCAAKNNVSIKQLLEAKSLQDRQAQERKAIGLLVAPVLAEKKKAFKSKNFSTGDDPQLQLVLAMSESLYEAEKMVKLEEAALLAGFPVECVKEMSDEERKKTLQSFGFTTSKPIADPPTANRQRKKKLLAPTALQTRTKADKDRVLTERIACILTGDDALTQVNIATVSEEKTCTVIYSQLLKRLEQTHNKLWDQTKLTKQPHNFYVNALKPHFIKSAQQPVESESHEPLVNDGNEQSRHMCDTYSVLYDPMELDVIIKNNQQVEQTDIGQQQFNMNKSKCDNLELEFVQNLSNNWKEALNDSSASDVLIFVKNNKHIYAHKLVFHVQCPNMLLDIESMDAEIHPQIERKISWLDKEQTAALAFLEFIYSGTICKYVHIFNRKELVQQVQQLARLYKVQDLFTYVRKKQRLLEHDDKGHVQGKESSSNKQFSTNQEIQAIPCETQVTLVNPLVHLKKLNGELVAKELITPKHPSADHPIDRQITASPDLFDSEEDEAHVMKVKVENNSDLENDGVIDEHLSSQKTLVNLSRSVSPVENIHEAVTPPSSRSPARGVELFEASSIFNQQEITEALTPKCRSPAATTTIRVVDVKQEAVDSAQDDLCNAVTPEHNSMAELNDITTPKKLVYRNMEVHDTASSPPQMDVDESIYTAVTPPRLPDKKPVQTIDENALKFKSELTMFIEKVQRVNAKDIMETDSEADTPDNQARRKNPFSKRQQDDSGKYLRNIGKQKYHKAISLLEKDVLNDERAKKEIEEIEIDTSMKNANTSAKGDAISQTDIDVTVDESEMSMYSKYKRSAKDDQNSIAVYRKKLNFSGHNNCIDGSIVGNDDLNSKSDTDSQNTNKPKPRIIEDVTLVSDSDEEKSPLRTLLRDKSKKKFHITSPVRPTTTVVVNKKDTTIDALTQRSNLENYELIPVDLVHESIEPNKNSMDLKLKEESKNKVIDLSVDSDEDDVNGNNAFPALDASSNKQISRPKQLQTSLNRRLELEMAEKKSEDIDAEISKILQSSQETIGDNADHGQEQIDESRNTRDLDIERKINPSSPISIVSSPEPCLELNQRHSQRMKNHPSKDNCTENDENGGKELSAFDDKSFKSVERPSEARSPPDVLSATGGNLSKSEDNKMSVLISSPILSQNRHSPRASQGKSLKITSGLRNKRPPPNRNSEDIRKLKTKSASTSTLTEKTRKSDSLQRAASFVTPEQNKRSSNNQKDVTPPINFSLLDTPDLQKELKKFGLKPQTRTKAKALLTHIYQETRSQKRTSSSSSDEDAPPAKRQYIPSDTKQPGAKNEKGSKAEKSSVIAEEMDFDDPDVAKIFQNPVSIKDAFFKLIKANRVLYNQVLTYEPLPLESLHAILNQNGFKCKINCLMDHLDEQCITFQVKTNKGDRTKKKQ